MSPIPQWLGCCPTRKTPLSLPFMHILGHVLTRLRFRTVQMLGAFGWLDTPLPFVALAFWIGLLLMLFLLTCAGGSRRWRALTVGIAVVTLVLPVVFEVSQARWYGFPWQGRYILPFAVGLPIAAAFALREGGVLSVRLHTPSAGSELHCEEPFQLTIQFRANVALNDLTWGFYVETGESVNHLEALGYSVQLERSAA